MGMDSSFRICVVGCGNMAMNYHGPSHAHYASTHPGVTLAACCDLDAGRASQYMRQFGFARSYADLAEMLDKEKPDAVCLFAPVTATCGLSCEILKMGYPLLMEKPPGLTVDETDRIISAATASGAPTQVAFNRRHMPLVAKLKRLLSDLSGAGGIQHIQYELTRSRRTDQDFSTTAIHAIDTVRFLAGSDYHDIRFRYQELPEHGPTVANVFMDCSLESGATAHIGVCPVSGCIVERVVIHSHDHTFFLNMPLWSAFDWPGRLQHVRCGELVEEFIGTDLTPSGNEFEVSGFYDENASFFEDIRNHRPPYGDACDARQSRRGRAMRQGKS